MGSLCSPRKIRERRAIGMDAVDLCLIDHAAELSGEVRKSLSRIRLRRLGMGRNEGLLSQIGELGYARVQKCMYSVGKWLERRW